MSLRSCHPSPSISGYIRYENQSNSTNEHILDSTISNISNLLVQGPVALCRAVSAWRRCRPVILSYLQQTASGCLLIPAAAFPSFVKSKVDGPLSAPRIHQKKDTVGQKKMIYKWSSCFTLCFTLSQGTFEAILRLQPLIHAGHLGICRSQCAR